MIATYEGSNAKSIISVEALKKVEDDALVVRVGSAPRVTISTSSPAVAQPMVEEEAEATEGLTELDANEKLMARLLEYKGSSQLLAARPLWQKLCSQASSTAWPGGLPRKEQRMTDSRRELAHIL